jgi:CheY-like chemotaxis protein
MTGDLAEAVQKVVELPGEDQDFFARLIREHLAVRAREGETAVTSREQADSESAEGRQNNFRVLVVDDEDSLLEFTRKCLEKSGFDVLVAGGSLEAIQVLEGLAEPVDLLITDCNMPGMSGPELIEVVANRWPTIKFVLTSGFLTDANHARMEPYNVGILAKPYAQKDITRAISEKLAE